MSWKIITSLIFMPTLLCAQIEFRQASTDITTEFNSGAPVVSADINGDSYDDLVRLDRGTHLCVDLHGGRTKFFRLFEETISNNPEWNLISGDVNNDGWYDIVASGISDRVKVLTAAPFEGSFERVTISDVPFFAQGSNLVDVNGDGFLDIFVCNDDALNRLYINDGTGAYSRNDTLIDFSTDPPSDNSGNYGSTWTDFDLDGDLDLYIAKCRVGVGDPTDPRRINMLYINTDTGFTEAAADLGLASGWQSWSTDFADIDNDGDQDIIVINHDGPAELFINDNGVYTDKAADYGLDIRGVIIQSIFRDFDHDGWVDLLVSGSLPKLLHNNEGQGFTEVDALFLDDFMSSFTLGDFNGDGFADIYATYNDLYNTPSNREDELWLTVPSDNNFIRLKLIGPNDKGAIGTKLFLYGPWGVQIRETRAGESYGIATSQIHTFGLGQERAQQIDSLVVQWAGGGKDVFSGAGLVTNATHVLTQGGCATKVLEMEQGPYTQCGSDTFELRVPEGYLDYLWSNGETSEMIEVTEPGLYHLTLTDEAGCTVITTPIFVQENNDLDDGQIAVEGQLNSCYGDTIMLTAPEGLEYAWSDGQTGPIINVTQSGIYGVTVTRACADAMPEPVNVNIVDPASLGVENDTVLQIGSGTLHANGDSVLWYADEVSDMAIASGNSFTTPVLDTTTTYYVTQFATVPGLNLEIGMPMHFGGSMYNSDNFNGGLVFDVFDEFTLDSVKVITDFAGTREIILRDGSFSVVHRMDVEIDSGEQWVPLGIRIGPGENYILTTDEGQNQQTFGTTSPKLWRSEIFVEYPYVIEDMARIKQSTVGQGQYYYFYDWQISTDPVTCEGERVAVTLVVEDTTSSIRPADVARLEIFPNPADDVIIVRGDQLGKGQVTFRLFDANGKTLDEGILDDSGEVEVSNLLHGSYFISTTGANGPATGHFIVMRK